MNKFILLLSCLFSSLLLNSQISDLFNLVEGEFTNFQSLYDSDEKLYGYLAVYTKGKKVSKLRNYEAIVFDNKLNQLLSQKFEAKSEIETFGGYLNNFGKLILYPIYEEKKNYINNQFQIDLAENKIEEYQDECIINYQIQPCVIDYSSKGKEEKRKNDIEITGFYDESNLYPLINHQYIATKSKNIKKSGKYFDTAYEIVKFDENKNMVWSHKDDAPIVKNSYHSMYLLHYDTSSILYMRMNFQKSKFISTDFISINAKTGEILNNVFSDEYKEETYYTFVALMSGNRLRYLDGKRQLGDKLYIIGSNVQKRIGLLDFGDVGFIKIEYDIKTGNLVFRKFDFWDFRPKLPGVDKFGNVDNYDLSLVAVFPFADGKDIFIFEKFKFGNNFWTGQLVAKNDDLVVVTTDANFIPADIKLIEKKSTKKSVTEFLFGQYLNDNKDLVFFYFDDLKKENSKEKDYYLYVNKIIKGQFSQDHFRISSEDHTVIPLKAKEGYILLREFNKEAKYNKIRLEKLNF